MIANLNARLGRLEKRVGLIAPPGHVCVTAIEREIVWENGEVIGVIRAPLAGPCPVCGKERRDGQS